MTAGWKLFSRIAAVALWIALALSAVAVFMVLTIHIHPPISDKTRRYAAKAQLEVFAHAVEAYRRETGAFPSAGEGLAVLAGRFLRQGTIPEDPWGHAYRYDFDSARKRFSITSLGADGANGGSGPDEDVVVSGVEPPR